MKRQQTDSEFPTWVSEMGLEWLYELLSTVAWSKSARQA